MLKTVRTLINHTKLMVAGLVFAAGLVTAGAVTLAQPTAVHAAAACDTVNIIHCGLDGSTLGGYINSLQSFYNKGADNGNNDLKAVYQWAGATNADISGMNASNTKVGTLYRNGDVKVDGTLVGTDASVTARFNDGTGFTHVEGNVYARKTTTSFAEASAPVIVHYDANGQVDFVVMTDCGNAVRVTPVKPTPKPTPKPAAALKCDLLTATATSTLRTYTFTAKATASNTTITSFVFNFGDGKARTVTTNANTATTTYTYAQDSKAYNASVAVWSADIYNQTSAACATTVTTPAPVVTPSLTCTSLVDTMVAGNNLSFKFVARASAVKEMIVSYTYKFGDGTTLTVKTADTMSSAVHTYATNNKTYVASVSVNSTTTPAAGVTSKACSLNVTTPKVEECKPGVPKGSAACNECKPGIPVGSDQCTTAPTPPVTPPVVTTTTCTVTTDDTSDTSDSTSNCAAPVSLVNTGPAGIAGIFAGTSAIGAVGHRLLRRRSLRE